MQSFTNVVMWVYIVLLLIGGLIGYWKAKSQVSLITSSVSAAILALCQVHGVLSPDFGRKLATVVMAALLVVFAIRLAKTRKFMPSGMLLAVTILALILRNL
ncbi:MAG: TMEM14 family protein [Verrucomicrobiota bacterium]